MFTGIIEEVGTIEYIVNDSSVGKISIKANEVINDTRVGDSIAVNGVCLTVVSFHSKGFVADVMPETLRRSNLGKLKNGDSVNLERAMAANGRFGGHIVSGHVDGTGIIAGMRKEQNAVWVTIKASSDILNLVVEKGSICIDGISLTVAKVTDKDFSVSIIPHTGKETTLLTKKVDACVNLETDVIGKYVSKLLGIKSTSGNGQGDAVGSHKGEDGGGQLLDFLQSNGF